MEPPKGQGITNKEQRKKTFSAGTGGGALPGLLVFGGALAVTGLIAVASFVANQNKAKARPHKPRQSDDASQGLPSPQDSTTNHDNACHETSNTITDQVHSCESTLILEDKHDLKVETCVEEESATSLHQEIVLSDDSPPESTGSFNDNGIGEEVLGSSADSPCFKEVDQSEPQEPLKSVDINEGQHDSDSATTETEDDIVEGDDDVAFGASESEPQGPVKSVEINEGKNDNDSATTETEDDIIEEDDDVDFGTSENSSEATGRTSLDSIEAATWQEPQQVKGKMVIDQSEAEGPAKSNVSCTYDKSHSGANISEFSGYAGNDRVIASTKASSSEKPNLYIALNYHLSVSKFKTWVILLLLFAILLLVVLTHRNRISGYPIVAIP